MLCPPSPVKGEDKHKLPCTTIRCTTSNLDTSTLQCSTWVGASAKRIRRTPTCVWTNRGRLTCLLSRQCTAVVPLIPIKPVARGKLDATQRHCTTCCGTVRHVVYSNRFAACILSFVTVWTAKPSGSVSRLSI